MGCRQSWGQRPKQDVNWLFSAWRQAFRQGSSKTQILLCRWQAPEKQLGEPASLPKGWSWGHDFRGVGVEVTAYSRVRT